MTSGAEVEQQEVADPPTYTSRPISDQIVSRTATLAATVFVPQQPPALARYAVAVGAPLLALAFTYPFAGFLQRAIFVLFWPAVIGAAWYGGLGPAVLASALAVLLVDYFVIGTPGVITPTSPDDLIPFGVFLFAAVAVSSLVNLARTARVEAAKAACEPIIAAWQARFPKRSIAA